MSNRDIGIRHEYYECSCDSDEHLLRFTYFVDPTDEIIDEPELYLNVFLDTRYGFWKRLWMGLKYAFGYKCKYGHFGSWIMKPEDLDRLEALLAKYRRFEREHD